MAVRAGLLSESAARTCRSLDPHVGQKVVRSSRTVSVGSGRRREAAGERPPLAAVWSRARFASRSVVTNSQATDSPTISIREGNTESEKQVLEKLKQIIDPDFGTDIVSCGFVKKLQVSDSGTVAVTLELTTPACPVKDEFEQQAKQFIAELDFAKSVEVTMTAQPPKPLLPDMPPTLAKVSNIIAVSSCKGGVGKSTVSVNLAYALAGMGAKVGIFDADVYGPSLPKMISPKVKVLEMDPDKRTITPVEYEGVKGVSFGFAGQGSAIMRGPMVSGVIQQLLTTSEWGELDYLVLDFPPGRLSQRLNPTLAL